MLKAREGWHSTPTQMLRRFLRFLVTDPAEIHPPMPSEEWAASPVVRHLITLERPYHPALERPFDVHLFREGPSRGPLFMHPLDPSSTDPLPDSGWSHWTGRPVQVHWLETDHVAILRAPVVNELAARLRALMDRHYAAQNGPARR
jgi:thioesterase domain-containing protein